MARRKAVRASKNTNGANLGYEAQLWKMADALRGGMDAAEYKHVVLGLIFLKYISDAFEEQHAKLEAEKAQGADPEDPDEYRALNIFWVPPEARWSHLKAQAKQPTIGQLVDDAMAGIERDNPSLKGVLPKDYARPGLDKQRLGPQIDIVDDGRCLLRPGLGIQQGEVSEGCGLPSLRNLPELRGRCRRPAFHDIGVKWGRIETVTAYARPNAPSRAQRVLRPRDTIVGTVRPGNGSYAFISEDGLTGSTGFAVLRPLRPTCAEFVYLAATARDKIEVLSHLADGAAYPAVRPDIVASTQIVGATDDVLNAFSRVAAPLLAKISQNTHESRTLAALRDGLLPKLISGDLRIKNVAQFVGARA